MASDTHDRILQAALRLFVREGFSSVTMRRIGAEVGVSAPALYRHYPSKDYLLLDLVKHGFQTFLNFEMRALQGKTPWERMLLTGEAYYDFAAEHPDYYRLMFQSEWNPEDPAIKEQMGTHAWMTFQFLVDRVRELVEAGLIKPAASLESTAFTVWGLVHGIVSIGLCGVFDMKGVNVRWQYDQALIALFSGLGTEKLLAENELVRHKSYQT